MQQIPTHPEPGERVLFVHAHPDDETIDTGGTIATLVDRGVPVTVLTCTRGELGEVIPDDLAGLEGTPALTELRESELAAAMAVLGVTDHRYLGAADARWAGKPPRRYTDSGMMWAANGRATALPTQSEDSLCSAEFGDVAADIATVIDAVGATAVISYDADGGYGHPDHVRAHQAARRAAEVMAVPFYAITPEPGASVEVDVAPVLDRKRAALESYPSQVTVSGDTFALSSGGSRDILSVERFRLLSQDPDRRTTWKEQGFGVHLLTYLLALLAGIAVGGVSTINHQFAITLGVRLPVGLVVSVILCAALLIGCRLAFPGRLVAICAAIGTLGTIALLSVGADGGSVLIPANPAGYTITYGVALIALVTLAWPNAGTFRRDRLGGTVEPKGKPSP